MKICPARARPRRDTERLDHVDPARKLPLSSPENDGRPRFAEAFESSGAEESRSRTTVFGPAHSQVFRGRSCSGNLPTGVLSSVGPVWAGCAGQRKPRGSGREQRDERVSPSHGNRTPPHSMPGIKRPGRGPPFRLSERPRGFGPVGAADPDRGEELFDGAPEVRRGRELRDPDPEGPAVGEAVGVPAGHRAQLVERFPGLEGRRARSRRSAPSIRSRARRRVASRTGRPARRSAIWRKIQGFFIVARPIITPSQPVSREHARARPRASSTSPLPTTGIDEVPP